MGHFHAETDLVYNNMTSCDANIDACLSVKAHLFYLMTS